MHFATILASDEGPENASLDWIGTIPDWLTAIFAGLALLVIRAAIGQLRLHNRQLHRELENHYLERFWEIWDARSGKFKRSGKLGRADRTWIQDYLTLSNDQVELRERGRVTDGTWDFWARDIARFCVAHPKLVREASRNYPALSRLLSHPRTPATIEDRSAQVYDPLPWPEKERRKQGLTE